MPWSSNENSRSKPTVERYRGARSKVRMAYPPCEATCGGLPLGPGLWMKCSPIGPARSSDRNTARAPQGVSDAPEAWICLARFLLRLDPLATHKTYPLGCADLAERYSARERCGVAQFRHLPSGSPLFSAGLVR